MNYEAKNRLTTHLLEHEKVSSVKRELVESTRIKLTEAAHFKLAEYSALVYESDQQAKSALQNIIYPWWEEFKQSAIKKQIEMELSEQSFLFSLNLSEKIAYYWPDKTIAELASAQPFGRIAEDFVTRSKDKQSLEKLIEESRNPNPDDAWTGYFNFSGINNNFQKFSFKPWNKARECYAFAVGVQRLIVSLDPADQTQSFYTNVNPFVYIEFGKQIENGIVWDVLEKSFFKALEDK